MGITVMTLYLALLYVYIGFLIFASFTVHKCLATSKTFLLLGIKAQRRISKTFKALTRLTQSFEGEKSKYTL